MKVQAGIGNVTVQGQTFLDPRNPAAPVPSLDVVVPRWDDNVTYGGNSG